MMRSLTPEDHDAVLSKGVAALVFRVAESPACQQFQPELDEFVRQHPSCPVWTVEAMEQRELSERHGLRALPTIVVYRDGLPARRFAGGMMAGDIAEAVEEVTHADMQQEFNDWMIDILESGDAGSPFVSGSSS